MSEDLKRDYGVIAPEVLASMDGVELLQKMVAGELPAPPIAKTLGYLPDMVEVGHVRFSGTPTLDYYNPIGTIHGGWIATLLDSCMACSVHSTLTTGQGYTTTDISIRYVKGVHDTSGTMFAEGRVLRAGRRMAIAEGTLKDADGTLYAHGTTSCLIFPIS